MTTATKPPLRTAAGSEWVSVEVLRVGDWLERGRLSSPYWVEITQIENLPKTRRVHVCRPGDDATARVELMHRSHLVPRAPRPEVDHAD